MSTTTTGKSLKRLSLLQSPTSTSFVSPPSPSFSSVIVASERVNTPDGTCSNTPGTTHSQDSPISHSTPLTNAPTAFRPKNARRQSSIYYVPSDRDSQRATPDLGSPVNARRFSTSDTTKNKDRDSVNLTGPPPTPAPALTLAERHADLLRFIAQKESKCLELRSQLAVHEAELLALKRKWERIVSRGLSGGSSPVSEPSLDDASAQTAVLTGLREGMQGMGRFLAQLGDLGAQSPDTNTSAGSGHTSTSSVSTTQTSSSMRLSQSSISSLGVLDDEVSEEREELSSHEKAIRRGSYSISTAVRRKPYEPSLPSPTSPPLLTPKTPFFSPSVKHTPSTSSKSPRVQTTLPTQPKHQKRPSMAQGSFKTASSMSGVSAGAPLVSWVDSVGKKLGQLHAQAGSSGAGTGAQHIHKRASTLLSDASHSLFAALTSPIIPTPSSRREHTPPTPYSAKSLLDDDDALGDWAGMATLSPDLPKLTPTQTSQSGSLAPVSSAEPQDNIVNSSETDSEEWNW